MCLLAPAVHPRGERTIIHNAPKELRTLSQTEMCWLRDAGGIAGAAENKTLSLENPTEFI